MVGIFADYENLLARGTIGANRPASLLATPGDEWSNTAAEKEHESSTRRLLQRLRGA